MNYQGDVTNYSFEIVGSSVWPNLTSEQGIATLSNSLADMSLNEIGLTESLVVKAFSDAGDEAFFTFTASIELDPCFMYNDANFNPFGYVQDVDLMSDADWSFNTDILLSDGVVPSESTPITGMDVTCVANY